MTEPDAADFERFVVEIGTAVERALIATYGLEVGVDAAAEAMVVAWERRSELAAMSNPAGYLYRVGQSKARPHVRWRVRRQPFSTSMLGALAVSADTDRAADLADVAVALGRLRAEQRAALLLVKAWGFTYPEAAALLDISEAAVGNHIRRGLVHLRNALEIT